MVQGLVFFPKQENENFALAIRGMGVAEEQLFFFNAPAPEHFTAKAEPEVVVVDIPKRKAVVRAKPKPPAASLPPAPPPPPMVPRDIPPLLQEDSSDMAAFVQSVLDRKPGQGKAEADNRPRQEAAPAKRNNAENAYVSREYVLRQFLALWADNKGSEMYDMLSEASRRMISRENFAKEVAKASDLRAGLKGDYRLEWIGEERAKVTVNRRLLMIRSLVTRTLGVTRENSSWKIIW